MAMQQDWVSKHRGGGAAELHTVVLIQIVSCCTVDQDQDQDLNQDQAAARTLTARRGTHDVGQTTGHQRDSYQQSITINNYEIRTNFLFGETTKTISSWFCKSVQILHLHNFI